MNYWFELCWCKFPCISTHFYKVFLLIFTNLNPVLNKFDDLKQILSVRDKVKSCVINFKMVQWCWEIGYSPSLSSGISCMYHNCSPPPLPSLDPPRLRLRRRRGYSPSPAPTTPPTAPVGVNDSDIFSWRMHYPHNWRDLHKQHTKLNGSKLNSFVTVIKMLLFQGRDDVIFNDVNRWNK